MTIHFISITLTLLLAVIQTQAQDYLITVRGDTLRGNINLQLTGKIENALIRGDKKQTISAIQTQEVVVKGKRYKPVQFQGLIQFMEIVNDGYLSLLAYQLPGTVTYDGRLLQKRDGSMMELPNLGFKKNISSFLNECPELTLKIREGQLGRSEINQIVQEFNDFIATNTAQAKSTVQTPTQTGAAMPTTANQTRLELLAQLKNEIEKSGLLKKQEALDMLIDVEEKLKANKEIPAYLSDALKNALVQREDWVKKLESLLVKN